MRQPGRGTAAERDPDGVDDRLKPRRTSCGFWRDVGAQQFAKNLPAAVGIRAPEVADLNMQANQSTM
jgi:hypothetical protein